MRTIKTRVFASLAVLSTVGCLIATGVGRARESASGITCQNNLKAIGLGLHNYCSVFDTFPPGTVFNPALRPEDRLSWTLGGMPFMLCMHCCGMNGEIGWDKSWSAAENRSLAVTPVFLLACPGLPSRPSSGYQSTSPARQTALCPTPYIGLAGVGVDAPILPGTSPRAGVFGYDRATSPADIKDGMSTTVMVAETSRVEGAWTAGGLATIRGLDPTHMPYLGKGRQFGGNHRNGAMVLLADGSVRFLRDSVSPGIFEALSTVAGGEVIGEGWGETP